MFTIIIFVCSFVCISFAHTMEREKRALEVPQTKEGSEKLQRVTPVPFLAMDLVARPLDRSSGFASLPIEISLQIFDDYFSDAENFDGSIQKIKTLKQLNRAHYSLIMHSPKIATFLLDFFSCNFCASEASFAQKLQLPAIQSVNPHLQIGNLRRHAGELFFQIRLFVLHLLLHSKAP